MALYALLLNPDKKIKNKNKNKKRERERERLLLQNIKTSKTGNWREQFKQPMAAP